MKWPVLKTIEFRGYYPYLSMVEKILQYSKRLVDSEDCPTLEKIIVSASFSLNKVFLTKITAICLISREDSEDGPSHR